MMLLEELSSDELDDDFAFVVGFATAEAFVAAQQLGPLVFVFLSPLACQLPSPLQPCVVPSKMSKPNVH